MSEYYTFIRKNEDTFHVLKWNNLQDVLLNGELKRQNSGYDVLLFEFFFFLSISRYFLGMHRLYLGNYTRNWQHCKSFHIS